MVTAFVRTILLYFIIMLGLRLMGKRQIGELEPAELVLTMLISDLAAVPMQDFGIPLLNGVVPIVTLLALSMLLSYGCMRSIRLRRLVCGSPTTLIKDGQLQQAAMRANRFTLDELIEALRSQGVTDLTTVKYAILETDGQLSVLLYPAEQPATPKQLGRAVKDDLFLPQVLINDGRVLDGGLAYRGLTRGWLTQELSSRGYRSPQRCCFSPSTTRAGSSALERRGRNEALALSPAGARTALRRRDSQRALRLKKCGRLVRGRGSRSCCRRGGGLGGAREALGAVYASWDARQTYFHIMVEHAELDAAEALFAVSHSFAESEDGAEFRANTAELLTQLRLLDEMEEISIKNIL